MEQLPNPTPGMVSCELSMYPSFQPSAEMPGQIGIHGKRGNDKLREYLQIVVLARMNSRQNTENSSSDSA